MAAISFGEVPNAFDPEISEWGNPILVIRDNLAMNRQERTWGTETS
jgi:hypothetical protein